MSIDWGTFPDYLAGSSALLALAFSGLALKRADAANRMQGTAIEKQDIAIRMQANSLDLLTEERKQWQAAKIAAWTEMDNGREYYVVFNQSDLPVFGVQIWREFQDAGEWVRRATTDVRTVSILKPGRTPIRLGRGVDLKDRSLTTWLLFTDMSGQSWARELLAGLSEISEDKKNEEYRGAKNAEMKVFPAAPKMNIGAIRPDLGLGQNAHESMMRNRVGLYAGRR